MDSKAVVAFGAAAGLLTGVLAPSQLLGKVMYTWCTVCQGGLSAPLFPLAVVVVQLPLYAALPVCCAFMSQLGTCCVRRQSLAGSALQQLVAVPMLQHRSNGHGGSGCRHVMQWYWLTLRLRCKYRVQLSRAKVQLAGPGALGYNQSPNGALGTACVNLLTVDAVSAPVALC